MIYFYPKDDTPGCTMEGIEFTDIMGEFEQLGVAVVGVSKDTCVSHAQFRDKYGLSVGLLADVEGQLCEAYGVWQEKEAHGEKKMGIVRSTFIVDAAALSAMRSTTSNPRGMPSRCWSWCARSDLRALRHRERSGAMARSAIQSISGCMPLMTMSV